MKYFQKTLISVALSALIFSPSISFAVDPHPKSVTQPKMASAPLIDLGAEATGGAHAAPAMVAPEPEPAKVPAKKADAHAAKADGHDAPHKEAHPPHWAYSGSEGPRYWGELAKEFGLCKTGKNQSPIDLKESTAVGTTGLPGFDVYYRDVPMKIINNGHTIQVSVPLGSYIKIGDHRFELLQYHFHTPSEHQKNGFNYPMEVHLVHKDGDGNLAVIGVIFQEGKENEYLADMLMHLPKEVGKEQIVKTVTVNPSKMFPMNKQFFKYSGSLTTPPCSEGVYWMVFKEPVEVSPEQIQQMNEIMGENARPVQPQNSRSLLKSYPDRDAQNQMYEFY